MKNFFELTAYFNKLLGKLQSPFYQVTTGKNFEISSYGEGHVIITASEAVMLAEKLAKADALAAFLAFDSLLKDYPGLKKAHEDYCNVGRDLI